MKILRSTCYSNPSTYDTMVVRDKDVSVPIEQALDHVLMTPVGHVMRTCFVTKDLFETPKTVDILGAVTLAERRHRDLIQVEHNQAILFFYDAAVLLRVNPGGVLAATVPAPLNVGEIQWVLSQLAKHPHYLHQTIQIISKDLVLVRLVDGQLEVPSKL